MKTKEYYALFETSVTTNDIEARKKAVQLLFVRFTEDIQRLVSGRAIRRVSSIRSVIEEVNNKWNRLGGMFEEHYEESPIVRDTVIRLYKQEFPELFGLPPKAEQVAESAEPVMEDAE